MTVELDTGLGVWMFEGTRDRHAMFAKCGRHGLETLGFNVRDMNLIK